MNAYEDVHVLKGNGVEYILQNDDLYTISSMSLHFYGDILFEILYDQFRMLETLKKDNTLYSKSVYHIIGIGREFTRGRACCKQLTITPSIRTSIQYTVQIYHWICNYVFYRHV